MSKELSATDALALVSGWDPGEFEIHELKGGLTNRTYRLHGSESDFVLRLDTQDAGVFKRDRSCELINLAAAADAGLGPAVIYSDPERGILICEFLQGRTWDDSDIHSQQSLESLAELLIRVHALPLCGTRLDVLGVAGAYEAYLEQRQGLHAFATRCVEIIAGIAVYDTVTCCHNDIVAANIVESSQLTLIDWEYSCDNDPLFDLASAIGYHNLSEKSTDILLSAYAGGGGNELRERLDEQIRVYDAIQWLWLASRHLAMPSAAQARRLEFLQQRIR